MSHPGPLNGLRARLARALHLQEPTASSPWVDPRPMAQALREVRQAFGDAEGPPPHDEVLRALEAFRRQGGADGFSPRQLKYVCHGVAVPLDRGRWSLAGQPPLLEGFVKHVKSRQGEALTFRRCYQGLLGSYFAMERQEAGSPAWKAWDRLRVFLKAELPTVAEGTRRAGHEPQWLNMLRRHDNLLSEQDRCRRYSEGLMRDDAGELRAVCEALGIQSTSWVWDEALLAYVQAVAARDERGFKTGLEGVLALLNGQREWRLPERVAVEGTALTVRRYVQCAERPEHAALRDTTLRHIGNPWLKRAHWDAWVRDEPARRMVDGWLKRRFIRDFFEALSEDPSADQRRLDYWLQWAERIDDIWFVLGGRACDDRRPEIVALRQRIVGRSAQLTGTTAQNNAFLMRIGPLLVVEFSQKGNACFVFNGEQPPVDLGASAHHIKALRGDGDDGTRLDRLLHVDRTALPWEMQFDARLESHIGAARAGDPSSRRIDRTKHRDGRGTATRAHAARPLSEWPDAEMLRLRQLCSLHGVRWEDRRPSGGAFWVFLADLGRAEELRTFLTDRGFRFKAARGFWRDD